MHRPRINNDDNRYILTMVLITTTLAVLGSFGIVYSGLFKSGQYTIGSSELSDVVRLYLYISVYICICVFMYMLVLIFLSFSFVFIDIGQNYLYTIVSHLCK